MSLTVHWPCVLITLRSNPSTRGSYRTLSSSFISAFHHLPLPAFCGALLKVMEKMCFSGLFCGNSVRSSWTKFYPPRTLRISANFYEHRLTGSLTLCQFKSATERNPVYPTSVLPRIIINITHLRDGHDSRGLCAPVRLWKSLGHAAATLTDSLNTDSAGVVVVGVGRERRIKGEICQNGRNKSLNVENVVGRNLWGSSPRI